MVKFCFLIPLLMSAQTNDGIRFPADAGVFDVTRPPYNADPTGVADATAAIQRALSDSVNGNRIIYLPNGVYRVTDTLRWGKNSVGANAEKRTILQGESEDGAILRVPDASPNFANPAEPRAVVNTGFAPAQRFRNALRNLTIDTGSRNSGAIALQFNCSNQGGLREVTLISRDRAGVCGLDLGYTDEIGPLYAKHVTIVGYQIGLRTAFGVNSATFEYLTLREQRGLGIHNENQVLNIRGLRVESCGGPAVINAAGNASLTLVDATLSAALGVTGGPAVVNANLLYARNVAAPAGYGAALQNLAGTRVSPSGLTVAEFSSHAPLSLFDGQQLATLNLPVRDPPEIPWDDPSTWANVVSFGAKGDGTTDDTAAFQAAVDSGRPVVYIPAGTAKRFRLDSPVLVRGAVRRVIGTEGRLAGRGGFTVVDAPGSPPAVILERFYMIAGGRVGVEQASARTVIVSSVSMAGFLASGPGDVFLEDVNSAPVAFENPRTRAWVRQLNPENQTRPKITNRGAQLWLFGLKTERGNTAILSTEGARTELLGAHIYSTSVKKVDPLFEIRDATASFAGVGESAFARGGNPFTELVRETRAGITRSLEASVAPVRNGGRALTLYAGYAAAGPTPWAVPVLAGQPLAMTVAPGGTATFTVDLVDTGAVGLLYRWSRDGIPLPAATTSTLTLVALTPAEAGLFTCEISNALGSVTSRAARLTVTATGAESPPDSNRSEAPPTSFPR